MRRHKESTIRKARELYEGDLKIAAIGRKLNIHKNTVRNWQARGHWKVKEKPKENSTVMVISDYQAPFEHSSALDFLEAVAERHQPDEIVNIGDECDLAGLSTYPKDPDNFSPGHELKAAIKHLRPLYELFPRCRTLISNHTARIYRKAKDSGIPSAFLKTYSEWLEAPPGWSWHDSLEVGEIRLEHGHLLPSGPNGAKAAPLLRGSSVVYGHWHTGAGIQWVSTPKSLWFSFNVGCLIDPHSPVFEYSQKAKTRPTLGTGVIRNGLPIWEPMLVKKGGRWTGKLLG